MGPQFGVFLCWFHNMQGSENLSLGLLNARPSSSCHRKRTKPQIVCFIRFVRFGRVIFSMALRQYDVTPQTLV
jgi:hypothetical protein